MKSIVIGAHLRREDIEPVAGAIPVDDLFLSGVPVGDDRPLGDRDLLLEIADRRARLLDRATFIAIRYGFTVRGWEDATAKCAARVPRWRELLIAHREEVEMTLKSAVDSPPARPDRRDFASGADYLRALHEMAHGVDIDPRFRAAVERSLVPLTKQHLWIHRDNATVELAMLVARANVPEINDAGDLLRREFPGVPFLLSGPWPLEVFADHDHQ
jgi:gas vesicle protein GvpL/GvpF